ncbi:MAG: 3-phosphoshikimate 1-carboxyvinyltransferase [Verrucomicrobia bacterium]|nr:3-phosphoshikimate 1-carboxyvinyltransferase [Verrucomicrobiota bacterium]
MARFRILPHKTPLAGEIEIPPSKSHTLRAVLFGMMARGTTRVKNYLESPDTASMILAARLLGATIDIQPHLAIVHGIGGQFKPAEDVIPCGNSGQVLRFIGALAGLSSSYTILTGDLSIRHNRPVKPLLDGLNQLGAFAISSRLDGYAPIIIRGPIKGGSAFLSGEDSQPISGLLIAGAFAQVPTELKVVNPGEKPWILLTLDWFDRLGIRYRNENFERYQMAGGSSISGFEYTVPGDFSSAAFPLAAALVTHSELLLKNLDMTDPQGDKAIVDTLQKMGARLEIDAKHKTIAVKKNSHLKGRKIDVNDFIDAVPILAVVACFADGETEIVNAAIARKKESDRIRCIAHELKKMGADIEEKTDGLLIRPSSLRGAQLDSHHDHRLALALSVAALGAEGESTIHGVECAAKTYPSFQKDFSALGAQIEALP